MTQLDPIFASQLIGQPQCAVCGMSLSLCCCFSFATEDLEQAIDDAEAEHMGIGMALDILGEEMQKLISRQNVSRAKLMALRAKRRL